TSISGTAPNRIFNIEWRASYFAQNRRGNPVNFEIRLYENQQRFDIVYGALNGNGGSATVGVQAGGAGFTQFECNSGGLSEGLRLIFQKACDNGGGACGPPVAGFTASPTNGSVPLTVAFVNSSSGATSYSWDFGDSQTST